MVACNASALTLGVAPGMRSSAALALAASLRTAPRQVAQELALLDSLANWSLQFTPGVSLNPPAGLLLEIGGCLRYFKGLPRLRRLVAEGLSGMNLQAIQAIAPTPLAASWLALHGDTRPVRDHAALAERLASLPLHVLPWPAAQRQRLQSLGLQTVGEVLALPRAGLARRFGASLPLQLDRALGVTPDPRLPYQPPSRFERHVELNWATDRIEALGFVAKRLLGELAAFLQGRGLGVQQLQLMLLHEDKTRTDMPVGLGRPTRSGEAMLAIVRERLARLILPAPVVRVGVVADTLHRLDGEALSLLGDSDHTADFDLLRARLVARLGEVAVRGIANVADHRPEHAWRPAGQGEASPTLVLGDRPGWLLPKPLPLEIRHERPWYGEPLTTLTRPERIESGWWDGDSVARDYYRAEGPSGRRYWVYQQRGEGGWYLHGLFA